VNKQWTLSRVGIAGFVAAAVVASGLAVPALPASAAPVPWRTGTQSERSVPGKALTTKSKPADPGLSSVQRAPATVTWPAAGSAEVALPTATVRASESKVRAGSLPVWVGNPNSGTAAAAGRLRVQVLDRAATNRAQVPGLLFKVGAGATGRVGVTVNYSSFRSAYGGDWASRLRLVELPACALSTPERTECRTGTPIPTQNAVQDSTLTADVAVSSSATVLAATAAPAGSAGDYKATALSASSSWEAGGSSGDFTWTYPMQEPSAFSGPEPDVNLAYSSGSVDGRTASTNNQSSLIGEGWDLQEGGAIERRYKACSDDVSFTPKPYDLCWETDNAFLTMGGKTEELVKDDTTGAWHPRNDDGSKVEHLTGATNFDNDGEYWKITARDGTQYYFGMHRLPGWTDGGAVTQSVWTVPVYGNDSGEPCHASTFAASYCTQAWRWNLDYVVDPTGNAMSYWYAKEWNYYGRNRTATDGTAYVRGGYLNRIDYGQRSDTMYSAAAPFRVTFGVEERCADGATCGTGAITKDTAKNWPDVPYDQACASGATCTDLFAPTFWSRKRLASVTTSVWVSGTTYSDVDSWALGYQFRDPGDGTSPALWLASITRSGKVGGSAFLPAVTFEGTQLANRVDAEEGIPPMYKWRLTDVYDESGGHVRVNYSGTECTRAAAPTPDSNTKRCFPGYWVPEGATSPTLDWFHKYVPIQVLEDDQSGVAGIEETDYEYLGGGAWHHDDNELTPAKYRTWSEWRGFARVRVTHGASTGVPSQTETLYFRGMNGDTLSSGTRSASVTDSEGTAVTDQPALTGFTREEITYNGVGGAVLDGEINDPWVSAATSTHGSTEAYLTGIAKKRSRLALSSGGWRRTETQNTFDSYGIPVQVNDLGDTSTTADDECTRTTYARNTTLWMINYAVRSERVGVACTTTPTYPTDVISDQRTFYDGSTTIGTAPTKGNVTLTQELASYSGTTPTYVQATRSTFDIYGRTLAKYDELDRKTTTAFTPTTGGAVTSTVVTDPMGDATTTTLDLRGEETAGVDPNGRRTDQTFDPLGRLTAVWQTDKSKAAGEPANLKFSYLVSTTAPNVVTTQSLRDDGGYDPAYALYDGRLRPRQTQEPASGGGRVVTDTFYDSRGLVTKTNGSYWNDGTAGTTLLTVTDNTVPAQTVKVYDGDERETASILLSYGTEKWRTTTSHGGDRVAVTPPAGGTATTTIIDAEGRTTELRQYTSGSPTGSYDATKYTYTKAGDPATVTDAAGNVWKYTYDLRGRKVTDSDPDKGTTSTTYDNADQVLTTTDARGTTLAYTYDVLGRKTGEYSGSTSGTQLAAWTFDTLASGTVVKGQPATATRYVDGNAYTTSVNGYDSRYRSLGTTVTIPAAEGSLAGSYKVSTGYTDTGLPLLTTYPAVGGLAAETLRYSYDGDGRLQTAQTGLSTLLTAATYSPYDEPLQYTLQSVTGKQVAQTFFYDDATRQLTRSVVDRTVSPLHLADVNYTYDAAGNVTKIADTPVGGTADTQCFTYDYLRRLASAWTATNACATAPATAIVGGPAPYWQSWTYDKTGNRLSETNYNTTSGVGVTSTSTYPAAGATRPHALSTVATGTTSNSFSYDAEGNTIGRTIAGSSQVLTWDAEGNLTKVVEGSKTTDFVYDADGNRIIRRDPDAVTLYLGGTEVKLTKSTGAVSATRYYKMGSVTAVRTTAGGLTFEAADRLGTSQLSINATDLTVTQRRYLPFGELRGTVPTWPTGKGYVGGTVDSSTGLTQLGARDYDPDTGRFMSVDPIIDTGDPQQMNAYAYANNTPVTMSDPDGQWRILPGGHYCDGCPSAPSKPKKKKSKPKSSPASHHFCDGCDYTEPLHPKKVYPGDLRKWDNEHEAEARRLAREYAAKLRREAAARKAKLAALAAKQKKWNDCAAVVGPSRTAKCGPNPADAGKPKENPVTHLWKHVYLTWSLCSPTSHLCGKLKFQHGKVSISSSVATSPATPSLYSLFPTIGYQHRVTGREPASVSGSVGRYGVGFGWNEHGVAWSDWDISVGTSPKGGWLGTENSGIAMFGGSLGASTPWSWCLIGSCK
jgi:RHS repeat-associated protein